MVTRNQGDRNKPAAAGAPPARIEVLGEHVVTAREPNTRTAVAVGPRLALANDDDIVCSYMLQSKLAVNDFVPMISRSRDGGRTWHDQGSIWPDDIERWSIFGSISRAPDGDLMFFGARTPIDTAGEPNWSGATMGLKQNELIWSRSRDAGSTWSKPIPIPMPIAGSAEAAGPICVTRAGRWLICYAPYNTFERDLAVDRQQLALLASDDSGATWNYEPLMRFAEAESGSAEAWVVELADGRLLATCWHVDHTDSREYPNPYALSSDGGRTWIGPNSTGVLGQSTSLAALPDGRALMLYNQRKHGQPGVYLAIARPDERSLNIEVNEPVWLARTTTQHGGQGDHSNWEDFSFGEPAAVLLPDGDVLVALWCQQPDFQGIQCLRVHLKTG